MPRWKTPASPPRTSTISLHPVSLPDTITPSLGCLLQAEIGANCPALDVNAACAGFLYALDLADALTSSGKAQRVLVVCAEGMTRMVDWTDRSTCVLFGDGAGAAVVDGGEGGLMATLLTSQGDVTHLNMYPDPGNSPFATCRVPARALHMDGPEIYKFARFPLSQRSARRLRKGGRGAG